jgi:hypothetical protein
VSVERTLDDFFLVQIIYMLQTPQEVKLEVTDDAWPRRCDENSQTVAAKHQSARYILFK